MHQGKVQYFFCGCLGCQEFSFFESESHHQDWSHSLNWRVSLCCNDPSWILRHVFVQHKRVQKYQKETPTATTAKTRFQHPHEQPQNFENHQTQTFFKPHPTPTTGRSGDRGCLGRRVQRPRSTSFTFGQRPLPYDLQFQQFFTLELGFLVFFCRCHRHRHRHHRDPNVF